MRQIVGPRLWTDRRLRQAGWHGLRPTFRRLPITLCCSSRSSGPMDRHDARRASAQVDHIGHGQFRQPHPWGSGGHGLEWAFRVQMPSPTPCLQSVWRSGTLLVAQGQCPQCRPVEGALVACDQTYAKRDLMRFFRADAAFAIPDLYEMLEASCSPAWALSSPTCQWHQRT